MLDGDSKRNPSISPAFSVNYQVTELGVGERSEVEELGFLQKVTWFGWHWVLLGARARAQLPALPLKSSPAWQLQDTVLKMSNQAICSERKITPAITALDFLSSPGAQEE